MKNLISIIALTLILSCCSKKDDDQPTNPISQLPPATQTGANTAGCLVNGQAFLPKGGSMFGSPTLSCFYQQEQDGFHLGLSISERVSSSLIKTVQFSTNPDELIENTTYNLTAQTNGTYNYNSNFGEFYILSFDGDINYITTTSVIGELKITKLNKQQRIISGTFWYDAINPQGDIVKIREGRFDMHYVN